MKLGKKRINLSKVFRMISITLILAVIIIFALKTSANCLTKDSWHEITVCRGDTLWTIAQDYKEDKNIQMVIYEIMKFNNLETSEIYPGQKLKIPLNF